LKEKSVSELTSLMERLDEEFSVTAIAQQKQSQQQSLF
jgi:ribosomal protein L7/L12